MKTKFNIDFGLLRTVYNRNSSEGYVLGLVRDVKKYRHDYHIRTGTWEEEIAIVDKAFVYPRDYLEPLELAFQYLKEYFLEELEDGKKCEIYYKDDIKPLSKPQINAFKYIAEHFDLFLMGRCGGGLIVTAPELDDSDDVETTYSNNRAYLTGERALDQRLDCRSGQGSALLMNNPNIN